MVRAPTRVIRHKEIPLKTLSVVQGLWHMVSWLRVEGFYGAFVVQGSGVKVQGSGFRVQDTVQGFDMVGRRDKGE